jgi:hypothetical protein
MACGPQLRRPGSWPTTRWWTGCGGCGSCATRPPACCDLNDEALPPFNITVRQTLSVAPLGYDYASFSSRTMVGG